MKKKKKKIKKNFSKNKKALKKIKKSNTKKVKVRQKKNSKKRKVKKLKKVIKKYKSKSPKKPDFLLKLVNFQNSLKPEFKFRLNFGFEKYIQELISKDLKLR